MKITKKDNYLDKERGAFTDYTADEQNSVELVISNLKNSLPWARIGLITNVIFRHYHKNNNMDIIINVEKKDAQIILDRLNNTKEYLEEKLEDEALCNGPKHCYNRVFDKNKPSCIKCLNDVDNAIRENMNIPIDNEL